MHIWSLTSVEFHEHFWDMVKFSLVFIRFLDKLLRFRGFLHKFMNLKSNYFDEWSETVDLAIKFF